MTKSFQESQNNPAILVNNKDDDARIDGVERRWKDNSARGNLIKFVQVPLTYGTRASVVNVSDLHGISSNAKRTEMVLGKNGFINKTNTYWVSPGELIDVNVEGHHDGSATESKANPNEEIDLVEPLIAPIASKCIAMTGATHDDPEFADRLKKTYFAPTRQIAKKFGIPFGIRAVFIEFLMPVYKGRTFLGNKSSYAVVLHGDGGASAKRLASCEKTFTFAMSLVEQVNRKYGLNITPDWIFGGHFHSNTTLDKKVLRNVFDQRGKATGSYAQTVRVRSGSSFKVKDSDSYNSNFYGEFDNNAMVHNWYLEENKNFNSNSHNEDAKYIVKPTEFAILNKKSNTFSPMAQEYMAVREDVDCYETIKVQLKGVPAHETIEIFNERSK